MNPSDVIAVISAAVSLFALWRTEQTRVHLLRSGWDEMKQHRGKLRPIARRAYAAFVEPKSDDWPKDLEALLGSVRMPPNVPIRKGAQIRNWYEDNHRQFNADQRRLWDFAVAVYPEAADGRAEPMENSIIAMGDRVSFDESHQHLATFFHRQWQATSNRRLFSVMPHTYEDVILLSWLELALVRATKDAGPPREGYGGKRGLYKYGRYLQKRHDR